MSMIHSSILMWGCYPKHCWDRSRVCQGTEQNPSIHPFSNQFNKFWKHVVAGAYPNHFWVKAVYPLDKEPVHHWAQHDSSIHPSKHAQFLLGSWGCWSLTQPLLSEARVHPGQITAHHRTKHNHFFNNKVWKYF